MKLLCKIQLYRIEAVKSANTRTPVIFIMVLVYDFFSSGLCLPCLRLCDVQHHISPISPDICAEQYSCNSLFYKYSSDPSSHATGK